jgi:hypothetical protein
MAWPRQLRLRLDDEDRICRAGEDVTGVVHFGAAEDETPLEVSVSVGWRVTGGDEADVHSSPQPPQRLVRRVGAEASLSFSVPLAAWPITYTGPTLSVEHFLRVDATDGRGRNAGTEIGLTVEPGPKSAAALEELRPTHTRGTEVASKLDCGDLAVALFALGCAWGATRVTGGARAELLAVAFALGGVAAYFVGLAFRNRVA